MNPVIDCATKAHEDESGIQTLTPSFGPLSQLLQSEFYSNFPAIVVVPFPALDFGVVRRISWIIRGCGLNSYRAQQLGLLFKQSHELLQICLVARRNQNGSVVDAGYVTESHRFCLE